MIELIIAKQIYLMGLISAFIIGGILREEGYFAQAYEWLATRLHNRKAVLAIMSVIGGILPIEGRCSVSAPILDGMVEKNSAGRKKMGLVDYISTHHYYLWSPIEPSVLIFMTALGISWFTFMQATILPLMVYFGFMAAMIIFYVDERDIKFNVIDKPITRSKPIVPLTAILFAVVLMIFDPKTFAFWYTFPFVAIFIWLNSSVSMAKAFSYIKWWTVLVVGIIISIGTIAKELNGPFLEFIQAQGVTVAVMMMIGGLGAFVMGSSTKYAGLGAAMLSIIGTMYLPLIVIMEFVGYLLSPVHKCLSITKMYFDTPIKSFYKFLIPLVCAMSIAGGVSMFYFNM